jgi:WD domain, G-beta repeat
MDLLGDIGTQDQLIATRTENAVLKTKVDQLKQQVQDLTLQVAILQAEVEIYRDEARNSTSTMTTTILSSAVVDTTGFTTDPNQNLAKNDSMMTSQQEPLTIFQIPAIATKHNYCSIPQQKISDLHGNANPTCVAVLSGSVTTDDTPRDRTILVTGGADATVRFLPMDSTDCLETVHTTPNAVVMELSAPVVCIATIRNGPLDYDDVNSTPVWFDQIVAAGTMDGHVTCMVPSNVDTGINSKTSLLSTEVTSSNIATIHDSSSSIDSVLQKHDKYVSSMAWSRRCCMDNTTINKFGYFLATASADGTIHIYTVSEHDSSRTKHDEERKLQIQHVESLYFDGAITCLCFTTNTSIDNDIILYAYVRNTPHLKVIRMPTNEGSPSCRITTLHLNASLLDDHVSFAVLDIKTSFDEKYVALACDNHCHLILDNTISPNQQLAKIVRKLYGHTADCYSRPVLAWSYNGQYIYSNTQNDTKLCIYSVASGKLLLEDGANYEHDNNNNVASSKDRATQQQPWGGHVRPIKDLYSHPYKNLLVTTSFDHHTILWKSREECSNTQED